MLEAIIPYLNAFLKATKYFEKNLGLVEIITDPKGKASPKEYCSGGEWKEVSNFDKYNGVSYWRKDGDQTQEEIESDVSCDKFLRLNIPLKLIVATPKKRTKKDDAYSDERIANDIIKILVHSAALLKPTLKARRINITVPSYDTNNTTVFNGEYSNVGRTDINYKWSYLSLNVLVVIEIKKDCMNNSCDPESIVLPEEFDTFCQSVKECLGISPSGSATKFLNEKGEFVPGGGGGLTCDDLPDCPVIQDIETSLANKIECGDVPGCETDPTVGSHIKAITTNQTDAMDNANAPTAANPFATQNDLVGGLPTGQIPNNFCVSSGTVNIPSGAGWVDIPGVSCGVTTTATVPIFCSASFTATKTAGGGKSVILFRIIDTTGTYASSPVSFTIDNATDVETGSDKLRTPAIASGTYTFKLQAQYVSGGDNLQVEQAKLFVQAQQAPKGDTGTPTAIQVEIGNGINIINLNAIASLKASFGGTIASWSVDAGDNPQTSGSIVTNLYKNGTSMIGAGNKPTIVAGTTASAAVSGWTSTAFVANDILILTMESLSSFNKIIVTFTLI